MHSDAIASRVLPYGMSWSSSPLLSTRRHVVFGRVIGESLLVLRKIENVQTGPNNKPKMQVAITECGEM